MWVLMYVYVYQWMAAPVFQWADRGWMEPNQALKIAAAAPYGYFFMFGSFQAKNPGVGTEIIPLGVGIMTGQQLVQGGYLVQDIGGG